MKRANTKIKEAGIGPLKKQNFTWSLFFPMPPMQNGIDEKFAFTSFTEILFAQHHLLGLLLMMMMLMAQISTCKHF